METQNKVMQITVTDRLKFEYIKMPTIDTSFRFLYRFKLPFETIWNEGKVSYFRRDAENFTSLDDAIKNFAMATWNNMVNENIGDDITDEVKWMVEMKGVDLIECEIQPKERSTDMK